MSPLVCVYANKYRGEAAPLTLREKKITPIYRTTVAQSAVIYDSVLFQYTNCLQSEEMFEGPDSEFSHKCIGGWQ